MLLFLLRDALLQCKELETNLFNNTKIEKDYLIKLLKDLNSIIFLIKTEHKKFLEKIILEKKDLNEITIIFNNLLEILIKQKKIFIEFIENSKENFLIINLDDLNTTIILNNIKEIESFLIENEVLLKDLILKDFKNKYTLDKIIEIITKKKYLLYEEYYKPNIIAIRDPEDTDLFNDLLIVFYKDSNNKWIIEYYDEFTTHPGTYFLEGENYKLVNSKGVAILKEGQYIDSFKFGTHKGALKAKVMTKIYAILSIMNINKKFLGLFDISRLNKTHKALVQNRSVRVYRDSDGDNELDFDNKTLEEGMFYIHFHRANSEYVVETIQDYSAGCQVFADAIDYENFMKLLEKLISLQKITKDKAAFTYTLLDKKDF